MQKIELPVYVTRVMETLARAGHRGFVVGGSLRDLLRGVMPHDYDMTTALIRTAKEQNLAYAVDIYPFYGSDAGAALTAGADVRYALIGPGVYASHGYERSHVEGAENTMKLIKAS